MSYRSFVVFVLVLLAVSSSFAGVSRKDIQALPEHYREWLEKDVAYIITSEEKEVFVHLPTDADRDKFIQQFWEIRNPNPGSPTNSYKDEIYRRIAYSNQTFGHNGTNKQGWQTDRGRVYITLGAPQQVGKYYGFANIRPMEIWFYQNDHPALPPFFYVVFYQKEYGDEFRLYSPFMDGPDKLVTGPTENDRVSSWNQIDHDAGSEVSRTVLSLIPTEPVDTTTATSSLQSDMLLNNIRGLANHPLTKDLLNAKRRLLESVSHRVIMHGDYLDVLTVSLVDPTGATNLHYLLRLKRPEDFTMQEDQNHKWFYSASVTARVLTPEGKLIFTQERKLNKYLDDSEVVKFKHRVFGYEGTLPLPPGKYKLEFQLNNDLAKTSFPDEREVIVPERPADFLRINDVVPFSDAEAGAAAFMPFTAAGVRFIPVYDRGLTLIPGHDLTFFYQLWESPELQKSSGNLQVQYAYGRMGMQDTKTIDDQVARNQFDANGTLINGKKIPTAALLPGNYRMAIIVTDPATHKRAVGSFMFSIADANESIAAWDVPDPQATEDVTKGEREYQRSLCYTFQGHEDLALIAMEKSYKQNPTEATLGKLIGLLYSQKAFDKIAALYATSGITKETDELTILQMAESLEHIGQVSKSIQLLESAVALRQSGPLYLALGRYYQTVGNVQKASEMEQKGKAMARPAPQS